MPWTCDSCTFENGDGCIQCEICLSGRPRALGETNAEVLATTDRASPALLPDGIRSVSELDFPASCFATELHPSGFRGLVNQGATCYLDSFMQTLFMTPEIRHAVYTYLYNPGTDGKSASCAYLQIQKLFARLQFSRMGAVSTLGLTTSFGWAQEHAREQQDVQEFIQKLFEALERGGPHTPLAKALENSCYGSTQDYVRCKTCGYNRQRSVPFMNLLLEVEGMRSLDQSIQKFLKPDEVDGVNCVKCDSKQPAFRGSKFKNLPQILQVQLKRFGMDWEKMRRIKIGDNVVFPRVLDMAPHLDEDFEQSENGGDQQKVEYELYSVLCHSGSAHAGHYFAFCKDLHSGNWFEFNDAQVKSVKEVEVRQLFNELSEKELNDLHEERREQKKLQKVKNPKSGEVVEEEKDDSDGQADKPAASGLPLAAPGAALLPPPGGALPSSPGGSVLPPPPNLLQPPTLQPPSAGVPPPPANGLPPPPPRNALPLPPSGGLNLNPGGSSAAQKGGGGLQLGGAILPANTGDSFMNLLSGRKTLWTDKVDSERYPSSNAYMLMYRRKSPAPPKDNRLSFCSGLQPEALKILPAAIREELEAENEIFLTQLEEYKYLQTLQVYNIHYQKEDRIISREIQIERTKNLKDLEDLAWEATFGKSESADAGASSLRQNVRLRDFNLAKGKPGRLFAKTDFTDKTMDELDLDSFHPLFLEVRGDESVEWEEWVPEVLSLQLVTLEHSEDSPVSPPPDDSPSGQGEKAFLAAGDLGVRQASDWVFNGSHDPIVLPENARLKDLRAAVKKQLKVEHVRLVLKRDESVYSLQELVPAEDRFRLQSPRLGVRNNEKVYCEVVGTLREELAEGGDGSGPAEVEFVNPLTGSEEPPTQQKPKAPRSHIMDKFEDLSHEIRLSWNLPPSTKLTQEAVFDERQPFSELKEYIAANVGIPASEFKLRLGLKELKDPDRSLMADNLGRGQSKWLSVIPGKPLRKGEFELVCMLDVSDIPELVAIAQDDEAEAPPLDDDLLGQDERSAATERELVEHHAETLYRNLLQEQQQQQQSGTSEGESESGADSGLAVAQNTIIKRGPSCFQFLGVLNPIHEDTSFEEVCGRIQNLRPEVALSADLLRLRSYDGLKYTTVFYPGRSLRKNFPGLQDRAVIYVQRLESPEPDLTPQHVLLYVRRWISSLYYLTPPLEIAINRSATVRDLKEVILKRCCHVNEDNADSLNIQMPHPYPIRDMELLATAEFWHSNSKKEALDSSRLGRAPWRVRTGDTLVWQDTTPGADAQDLEIEQKLREQRRRKLLRATGQPGENEEAEEEEEETLEALKRAARAAFNDQQAGTTRSAPGNRRRQAQELRIWTAEEQEQRAREKQDELRRMEAENCRLKEERDRALQADAKP